MYLDEDEEGLELGRDVEHEPGVGGEPLDVAFVAGVDEDGGGVDGALVPVGGVDEVLLVEDMVSLGPEGEVVQLLGEEVGGEWELGVHGGLPFLCQGLHGCAWGQGGRGMDSWDAQGQEKEEEEEEEERKTWSQSHVVSSRRRSSSERKEKEVVTAESGVKVFLMTCLILSLLNVSHEQMTLVDMPWKISWIIIIYIW